LGGEKEMWGVGREIFIFNGLNRGPIVWILRYEAQSLGKDSG
jgi:hypothetical protein